MAVLGSSGLGWVWGQVGDRNILERDLCSSQKCPGGALSPLWVPCPLILSLQEEHNPFPSPRAQPPRVIPILGSASAAVRNHPCAESSCQSEENLVAQVASPWAHPHCHPTRAPGLLPGGSPTPANPLLQQAAASSKQLGKIQWDLFAWI